MLWLVGWGVGVYHKCILGMMDGEEVLIMNHLACRFDCISRRTDDVEDSLVMYP